MKRIALFCLMAALFASVSCTSDQKISGTSVPEKELALAKEILDNDIVLSSKVTMNGVDKTKLPDGCPTRYRFTWDGDNMTLALMELHIGDMPFNVSFKCRNTFSRLNSWEEKEYKGEGWVKFSGKDGNVILGGSGSDTKPGSGATVTGFLNVKDHSIEIAIDFNMMNVKTDVFRQAIDKSRIGRYEQELRQYEADLQKWKEENPGK